MSHDQRPGKLRVVKDATRTLGAPGSDPRAARGPGQRAGSNATNGTAGTGANAVGPAAGAQASAAGKTLPMLQAGIFLLACVIGGVAVAIVRPF